jgi:hypothetical protein
VALSWVIGTLSLSIFKLSSYQSEGEHVLEEGRDNEKERHEGSVPWGLGDWAGKEGYKRLGTR